MKIKMKKAVASPGRYYASRRVYMVDDSIGLQWISQGIAEAVETKSKKPKTTTSNPESK